MSGENTQDRNTRSQISLQEEERACDSDAAEHAVSRNKIRPRGTSIHDAIERAHASSANLRSRSHRLREVAGQEQREQGSE
jgi:hypothetical protein